MTAFGAILRFTDLGRPNAVMFDETYYAKDSLALFKFGAEHNVVKDADKILMQGGTQIWQQCAPPSWTSAPPTSSTRRWASG